MRRLGVEPRLDGVAVEADVLLPDRQRLASGDADLQLDEVEPGDHLRDRMLHLQARVHLQEVERAVAGEQELDRARVGVADRLRGSDGGGAHALRAAPVRHGGRRRLLDHLLVAALHRAVALAQVDDVAVRIGRAPGSPRGAHRAMAFSRIQLARAERALAPRPAALASAAASRSWSETSRMPRPPPPAAALTIRGKPMRSASSISLRLGLVAALVARHARHAGLAPCAAWPPPCCPWPRSRPAADR